MGKKCQFWIIGNILFEVVHFVRNSRTLFITRKIARCRRSKVPELYCCWLCHQSNQKYYAQVWKTTQVIDCVIGIAPGPLIFLIPFRTMEIIKDLTTS